MTELFGRMSRVELHLDSIKENFKEHCDREETYRERAEDSQSKIMELLQEVRDKQAKMSGFWAGTVFAISAIATGLTVFFSKH